MLRSGDELLLPVVQTIIASRELNFRVRNGIGCIPADISPDRNFGISLFRLASDDAKAFLSFLGVRATTEQEVTTDYQLGSNYFLLNFIKMKIRRKTKGMIIEQHKLLRRGEFIDFY